MPKYMATRRKRRREGTNVSLSGSGYNVPVDLGLEAASNSRQNHVERIDKMDDFVFAYRLYEIIYMVSVDTAVYMGAVLCQHPGGIKWRDQAHSKSRV